MKKDPSNENVLLKLARTYVWQLEYDKAQAILKELMACDPSEKVFRLKAEVLLERGELEKAISLLKGRTSESDDLKALYARALLVAGEKEEVLKTFSELIPKDPQDNKLKTYVADAYFLAGEHEKGEKLHKEVFLERDKREVQKNLAAIKSFKGEYIRLLKIYDELLGEKYDRDMYRQKARVLGWARNTKLRGKNIKRYLKKICKRDRT